jgi:hypothetical protein
LAKLKALPKFEALAPISISLEMPGVILSLWQSSKLCQSLRRFAPIYFQDLH